MPRSVGQPGLHDRRPPRPRSARSRHRPRRSRRRRSPRAPCRPGASSGPPELPGSHLRPQRVDLAGHRGVGVDVRPAQLDQRPDPGRREGVRTVQRVAGDDRVRARLGVGCGGEGQAPARSGPGRRARPGRVARRTARRCPRATSPSTSTTARSEPATTWALVITRPAPMTNPVPSIRRAQDSATARTLRIDASAAATAGECRPAAGSGGSTTCSGSAPADRGSPGIRSR